LWKSDPLRLRRRCRICCRVPTASSPMGSRSQGSAAGAGQLRPARLDRSPASVSGTV
jgi:hypothetical protein